jgi:hypothetical protein
MLLEWISPERYKGEETQGPPGYSAAAAEEEGQPEEAAAASAEADVSPSAIVVISGNCELQYLHCEVSQVADKLQCCVYCGALRPLQIIVCYNMLQRLLNYTMMTCSTALHTTIQVS